MATIAKLVTELTLDDQLSGGLDKTRGKLDSIAAGARKTGTILTAAVTAPIVAFGVKAFQAASDVEEAVSKVNVVFEDSASEIHTWATSSAQNMGLSSAAALQMAGTFGNLFTNMGFTQAEAAGMSMKITQLGADLSSFNNVPVDQALNALQSALVGEFEPMRQFGVMLSEATVKQKAMELGLFSGTGAISANARATATMALIYEQTTTAQGDFARTSDGAANSMRIAKAEFTNAAAALGSQLLPHVTTAIQGFTQLVSWFNNLSPSMQRVIGVTLALAAALGPILIAIGTMIPALTALAPLFAALVSPIGLVVVALAGLLIAYQTNFLGFKDGVNRGVSELIARTPALQQAFVASAAGIKAAWSGLQTHWGTISAVLMPGFAVLQQAFANLGAGITTVLNSIGTVFTGIVATIQGVMALIKAVLTGDWQAARDAVVAIVEGLRTTIVGIFTGILGVVTMTTALMKAVVVAIWDAIGADVIAAAEALRSGVANVLNLLLGNVSTFLAAIQAIIVNAFNAAKDAAIGAALALRFGVIGELNALVGSAYSVAVGIGSALGQGLVDGISGMKDAVVGAAADIANAALDILKGIPGIGSPSRVTTFYGEMIGAGYLRGLESMMPRIERASMALATSAVRPTIPSGAVRSASMPAPGLGGFINYGTINVHANNPRQFMDALRAEKTAGVRP